MTTSPRPFPGRDNRPASRRVRDLATAAVVLAAVGVALGTGPAEGSASTIVLLHVPAAWLSLLLYTAAAGCAALALAQADSESAQALQALAPVGVIASAVALGSGLAGQRALGTWWGWDARLVCELVLLVLYGAAMGLRAVIGDTVRARRAVAVLVLVGALDIPAIYFSVNWWHTLHERAAASVGHSPSAVAAMVAMTLAFCMSAGAAVLARLQSGLPKEQQ